MRTATSKLAGISRPHITGRFKCQVWGPDGELKQTVGPVDNILTTFGLNRLCELIVGGGEASTAWVQAAGIGTVTTALVSTDNNLGAVTQTVALSGASMAGSDAGNMTMQYNLVFSSINDAHTIGEIGLFATSSVSNDSMIAGKELGASSINRGAADAISATYSLIFATG